MECGLLPMARRWCHTSGHTAQLDQQVWFTADGQTVVPLPLPLPVSLVISHTPATGAATSAVALRRIVYQVKLEQPGPCLTNTPICTFTWVSQVGQFTALENRRSSPGN